MHHSYLFWIGFHVLIAVLLWIDLALFRHKKEKDIVKKSLFLSVGWIALALVFNGWIYWLFGKEPALQFLIGYLIEKSLSVDNMFVFLLIFTHFKIPSLEQHRILILGIIGALVLRIVLILVGIVLIKEFSWITYVLGAFLCFTGVRLVLQREKKEWSPDRNALVRIMRKILPFSEKKAEGKFFVKEAGRWKFSLIFMVLILIESSDLVFALDSIPAIFAITKDPFIIYTSNVFAILGLRELYFVLKHFFEKLRYFKFGLSAILIFIGLKMVFEPIFPIPIGISLGVVMLILGVTAALSWKLSSRPLA